VCCFSVSHARATGTGWHRPVQDLKYSTSKVNRDQNDESGRCFYQLSFSYDFQYDNDEVYFAYSMPYSFSMCLNFIKHIAHGQQQNLVSNKMNLDYKIFDFQVLTQSLGGVDVPIITISN